MTPDDALNQIKSLSEPGRADGSAAYHKVPRVYLGVPNPALNDLTKQWRKELSIDERVSLARDLWETDIHEARIAAAKLLTQARIKPDEAVWSLIQSWVPSFDAWAIADHACMAGQRRLTADPTRLDIVETWTTSPHMWTRRAALVISLPWAKLRHASTDDLKRRDRILSWAAAYVDDKEWFIQKAVAWWVRDLSKHDPARSRAFLDRYGGTLKPFARREAGKYLTC